MPNVTVDLFAHTLKDQPPASWEPLETHLAEVENLASEYAGAFQASLWGAHLGRCHDLGKASRKFQEYLHKSAAAEGQDAGVENGTRGRVDHSTFGARYVAQNAPKLQGQILAYCIAGHHGGLPNAVSDDDATQEATLRFRLQQKSVEARR